MYIICIFNFEFTGSPVNVSLWAASQPAMGDCTQTFISAFPRPLLTASCSNTLPFICQNSIIESSKNDQSSYG